MSGSTAINGNSAGSRHSDVQLLVAAGGTGGHVYPAVTTVRTLREELAARGYRLEVLWVGQAGGLESTVAAGEGIRFAAVATGKIRRAANPLKMFTRANAVDMLRVPLGIAQAWRTVGRFQPDVVLATGGYVTVPVGLAAWLRRRPLVVHEQTVRLGLANRVLARLATRVALSSESSLPLLPRRAVAKSAFTGNPVRPELFDGDADKAIAALGVHGFDRSLPTIYVTGGAQGAVQINRVVRELLPWLLQRANVIHQCGKTSVTELREHAATLDAALGKRYVVTEFIGPELADVFALADVVISRSGAGTIAELTALGKASVLIPLASSAGNEQAHNAATLAEHGAAVALLRDVAAPRLREAIEPLLTDPSRRATIAEHAREHGRPNAARELAQILISVACYDRRL
ncbi:UDP-N-acetylglucosamine--N-acetylmuramyl-(pentapeptide) pyrophosphoryl-undecaprenol N-acetylglucosamine transferase [Nocardia sp. NBC_00508]|uniref:UDP-N-acetylglucosamine--N-acetylmuramyl- (pentapeptide) pyrophosphoryl-undecaprenol N-acetylglucosamine transferase n=1 Tax=Nocardia sp. NBC_00508 TaxID=2975992 RepID=UPI002E80237A|nr:UDP-N-acetylglucosamine--N-acetylmuramyl-(pentapeptide) pyrophosphoryl-undecaprenol N-acetylglucosamine transferase [Nocardia sp. NBC_00508]WUD65883.1 UDP-N-acetylglucosamine--N-acetylmuramyl-(pentapeptide) pyrophosphoryl-undecaprenol N-acetylglucosamine transferase [Nocardia sp. NBC_00508]